MFFLQEPEVASCDSILREYIQISINYGSQILNWNLCFSVLHFEGKCHIILTLNVFAFKDNIQMTNIVCRFSLEIV